MNVYDFDGTIYRGDSTLDFYMFCVKKKGTLVLCLPYQITGFILYKCRIIDKTQFKEMFYSFLLKLNDVDKLINEFWDINLSKVYSWFYEQKSCDDVIISASPEFLIKAAAKRLEINHVIASKVNSKTGKTEGLNCYGEEKVRRFQEVYGTQKISMFFSDSLSDQPMAEIAEEAYLVKRDGIERWKR